MLQYEIQRAILKLANEAYDKAKTLFPTKIFKPFTHAFDLTGSSAGQVQFNASQTKWHVRYNMYIASHNYDEFMKETVVHEIAHLVARNVYGANIKPHGVEWKTVMRKLGYEPETTHTMECASARQGSTYKYKCNCDEWDFTSIRHNRVLDGKKYSCPKCHGLIKRA